MCGFKKETTGDADKLTFSTSLLGFIGTLEATLTKQKKVFHLF